jgi:hypothetical protein
VRRGAGAARPRGGRAGGDEGLLLLAQAKREEGEQQAAKPSRRISAIRLGPAMAGSGISASSAFQPLAPGQPEHAGPARRQAGHDRLGGEAKRHADQQAPSAATSSARPMRPAAAAEQPDARQRQHRQQHTPARTEQQQQQVAAIGAGKPQPVLRRAARRRAPARVGPLMGEERDRQRHRQRQRQHAGELDRQRAHGIAQPVAPVGFQLAPVRAGACCCRCHDPEVPVPPRKSVRSPIVPLARDHGQG